MARLKSWDAAELDEADRALLHRPIELHRVLVNSPGGARAFGVLGSYIRQGSPLDPRLRELAILQVGWLARSPYEWSHHVKIGRDFGVSDADIHALIAESAGHPSGLDAQARCVLQAAREAAAGPGISAELFERLKEFLTPEALTDLVLVIGFYAGVVRVLASLGIEVEAEYLPYLKEFPLPT